MSFLRAHIGSSVLNVSLEIISVRGVFDLVAREPDAVLRSLDAPAANLVGQHMAQVAYAIYGTRQLLERVHSEVLRLSGGRL